LDIIDSGRASLLSFSLTDQGTHCFRYSGTLAAPFLDLFEIETDFRRIQIGIVETDLVQ